ncbi:MAG: hypothetical protein ACRDIY_06220 [Chloroflexota bacterium]
MQQSAPGGASTQLIIVIAVVLFIGYRVYRRTRPQKVRLWQTLLYTVVIVGASIFGVVGTGSLPRNVIFLLLVPIALIIGYLVGVVMMRTIHFWRDAASGDLWMRGGAAYVVVWLLTYVLRLGVRFAAGGSFSPASFADFSGHPSSPVLGWLASDLLFLSVGLWIARAVELTRRHRSRVSVAPPGNLDSVKG